jgi:hypothetical protein
MYTKLPTYKKVVVDLCSRSLEFLSRLSVAIDRSQAESLRTCLGLLSFTNFTIE